MNAGKTTHLIQAAYNYKENGMNPLVLKPAIDTRTSSFKVRSRSGLSYKCETVDEDIDLYEVFLSKNSDSKVHCILVDEAQFLTKKQIKNLRILTIYEDVPVLAYGLRTDFRGDLFEGSKWLISWADNLKEIKAVCHCGKKATMVLRVKEELSANGTIKYVAEHEGNQIEIGGNNRYVPVCYKHWNSETIK